MEMFRGTISGDVTIPADSAEDAKTILEEIVEQMKVDMETTVKAENCGALTSSLKAGTLSHSTLCTTTLERMTRQQTMPVE